MKSIKILMFKIISISILAIMTLQACSMPINTPTVSGADSGVQTADTSEETITSNSTDTTDESQTGETTSSDNISADEVIEEEINPETSITLNNGLTQAEVDSLVFMREEEKLARDVYLALYDIWQLPLFQNIAKSEQTHTDSVVNLLVSFNIPDPADNSPAGVFVNEDLQSLYDELTALGGQSLADALKVGAAIEEIDILDLQETLEFVQDPSIQRVYENLLKGSENHLRAFTSTLENQTGEIYEPQYMSSESYFETINSEITRGNRGNGRQP